MHRVKNGVKKPSNGTASKTKSKQKSKRCIQTKARKITQKFTKSLLTNNTVSSQSSITNNRTNNVQLPTPHSSSKASFTTTKKLLYLDELPAEQTSQMKTSNVVLEKLTAEFPQLPPIPVHQRDKETQRKYLIENSQWERNPNCKATVPASYRNYAFKPYWLQLKDMVTHGRTRELEEWLGHPRNKNKINLNSQDWFGSTFLCTASRKHLAGMVKLLLRHGADPNFSSVDGPPLFSAISTLDAPIAKTLIQYGADVNYHLPAGQTPLMIAASVENSAYLLLLYENGGDVNSRDSAGRTPLMYAARRSNVQQCSILLERGADINAVDCHQMTPLHYALDRKADTPEKQQEKFAVSEFLKSAGGIVMANKSQPTDQPTTDQKH